MHGAMQINAVINCQSTAVSELHRQECISITFLFYPGMKINIGEDNLEKYIN